MNNQILIGKIAVFLRKYFALFLLTVGYMAFGFLLIFLAGGSKAWLLVLSFAYMMMAVKIFRRSNSETASFMLGLFLLFVFAQSSLMDQAGITPHSTLRKFAGTLRQELAMRTFEPTVIGVGSHDIHEKEFQVYFDRKVVKAADDEEEKAQARLDELFAQDAQIYCLMTNEDYERRLKGRFAGPLEIIQEGYIFRRRMFIDGGFFLALLKLDRETVNRYLKEKIILIRKDLHV